MPHPTGSSLLNWLVADFNFFGWDGQNWMVVLFAGAAVFFIAILFASHGHKKPPSRV